MMSINGLGPALDILRSLWDERPHRTAKMKPQGAKYVTMVKKPDGTIEPGAEYGIDKNTGEQTGDGTPLQITDAMLIEHLQGKATYAVPLIGADGMARALVIELDNGGEASARQMLEISATAGLIAISFVCPGSDGHDGSHTWIMYDQAWNPERLREQSRAILRAANLPQKEVYPSKANIRLPFGKHVRSKTRGVMISQDGQRFTLDEYPQLIDAALYLNTLPRNTQAPPPTSEATGARINLTKRQKAPGEITPLDDYDERATRDDIEKMLVEAGWNEIRQQGSVGYWVRPGKNARDGHSATLGHVDDKVLSVFSEGDTSLPGESGRGIHYGPAKIYTHLKHGGDFSAAAKALYALGYGTRYDSTPNTAVVSKATRAAATPPPIEDGTPISRGFLFQCLKEDQAGDAQLVEALYRGKLCYDTSDEAWYEFVDHAWQRYPGTPRKHIWSKVAATYLACAAQLQAEAEKLSEDNEKRGPLLIQVDAFIERARKLRSVNRINAVLTLASELLGIDGSIWDSNPWLLGVDNGTLDLKTGALRDGRPDDYIRTTAPTEWKGLNEPCPRWERFMSEVMSDEQDRVAFLQRFLGYAVNGTTKEHVLGIFVGTRGRNGKRVLFETLQHVLGDYATTVSTDVVIGQDHKRIAGSAQPHLMELQGKRITYCSETDEHATLSTAQVKNVTGGDPITARWLHANPVTFVPTHTLFLQTNRKPQAPSDDDALWERVKVIEFKVRFVENPTDADERPRDLKLEETLRAEASGILAWLVRGGIDWQKGGLQTPDSVKLARETYRREVSLDPFINDCCEEWDGGSAEGGALYQAYKEWCEHNKFTPKSPVWFGRQLVQRYEKARVTTGENAGRSVYYGVSLKPESERAPATLQDTHNPSVSIRTPNTDNSNDNPEGLRSFSKSSMQNSTHEEKNMQNPSNPSGFAEKEDEYRIEKPTEGMRDAVPPRPSLDDYPNLTRDIQAYIAAGKPEKAYERVTSLPMKLKPVVKQYIDDVVEAAQQQGHVVTSVAEQPIYTRGVSRLVEEDNTPCTDLPDDYEEL